LGGLVVAPENVNQTQFSTPKPYFPHRGSKAKREQPTQGKLFADPKPEAATRYPRGYTPERMAEVQKMPLNIFPNLGKTGAFSGPAGKRRIQETIARSATPAKEFPYKMGREKLQIQVAAPPPDFNVEIQPGYRVQGGYRADRGGGGLGKIVVDPGRPRYKGQPPQRQEEVQAQTLMHEMGHARSDVEQQPHSRPKDFIALGQEEAFADENMLQRWKPDPRDVRARRSYPPSPAYEDPKAFSNYPGGADRINKAGLTKGDVAGAYYRAARTTPLTRDQLAKTIEHITSSKQMRLSSQQFKEKHWNYTLTPEARAKQEALQKRLGGGT
jgi:hypothetical protein